MAPRTEPSADMRAFAASMWQMYQALVQEGFTEAQALTIIADVIRAGMGRQQGGDT